MQDNEKKGNRPLWQRGKGKTKTPLPVGRGSRSFKARAMALETTSLELHLEAQVDVPGNTQVDLGIVGVMVLVEAVVRGVIHGV